MQLKNLHWYGPHFLHLKCWVWAFTILCNLTISCGREDYRNIYKAQENLNLDFLEPIPGMGYVNPAFRRYVSRFEKASGRKIMDRIVIDFGSTGRDEAANCRPSSLSGIGVSRITVSKSYWRKYSQDFERELIIFHELGHCALGRGHKKTWGGITSFHLNSEVCAPLSIMYPEADWTLLRSYQTHREYYVKELVGKSINQGAFEIVANNCAYWLDEIASLGPNFRF